MGKTVLMQGNEACVEGAIAAGMRLFAGYPITPSTEVAEQSALLLPLVGGTFIQMEDEISSMAVVIGASAAGVKSMTATSGPGFSLKQENLGYAALAEIPCVVVNVQRSGPSTGIPTAPAQGDVMQSRWGTHGDHPAIVLSPSSVRETYDLIIHAFHLSEKYRTPVIFLMDEIIGHLREGITIPDPESVSIEDRYVNAGLSHQEAYAVPEGKLIPEMAPFGQGLRYNITGLFHDDSGFPTDNPKLSEALVSRLLRKIEANQDDILQWEESGLEDAQVAVVCYGGTAGIAASAVEDARAMGVKAGIFRPITIWPFPEEALRDVSKKVDRILVAEHNAGQLLLEVERIAAGRCAVDFIGRINGSVIEPDEILSCLTGETRKEG
ncbi:MAG: 2-oxoacid:acceptor oxidoreductase subunit alpha [Clostridiales bacterium]|nr:2-oxoacid:acceptor oxidoreductase subunit alpha [Clostridiales bacterium]